MARQEEIIIEVEVNAGESAERLAAVQARIHDVKQANKELKAEQRTLNEELRRNGTITHEQAERLKEISAEMAKNNADLKELTATEKMYTAQLNTATQNDRKFGDSLVELSAQLAQLKQEYRGLTAAQRESAEGKAMLDNIKSLDKTLKDADASMGDFQRNVGNYQSALLGLNGNVVKVANLFQGGFKNGIAAAGTALKGFITTMLTTPFGWIVTSLAAVAKGFDLVSDAIKRSDDLSTQMQENLAGWEATKTQFRRGWDKIAQVVVSAFTKIRDKINEAAINMEVYNRVMEGESLEAARKHAEETVKANRKVTKSWEDLIKAEDDAEEAQRNYTVNRAVNENKIQELENKSVQTQKYSAKERKGFLEEIAAIEKEDARIRHENALMEWRNLEQRQKLEGDYSDEMKNRIADAHAATIKAWGEYEETSTRVTKRIDALQRQLSAGAKQRSKEVVEALKKEEEAYKSLQELRISMIKDEEARNRAKLIQEAEARIAALKLQLEEGKRLKNLTEETVNYINEQILLSERKLAEDLAKFDKEAAQKRHDAIYQETDNIVKMRVDLMEDGIEKEIADLNRATAAEMENLRRRAEAEGVSAEQKALIQEQMLLLSEQQAKKEYDIQKKYAAQEFELIKKRLQIEMEARDAAAGGNDVKEAEAKLQYEQQYYDALVNMDEAAKAYMYKTDEEYELAKIESEKRIKKSIEDVVNAELAQMNRTKETLQALGGSMSDLFEAIAGDSEEYEAFKKAMAIADASISLAQTIAAATSASTAGDPYTMAIRIASNVAAVTAQFAAVVKAIKAASIPSAPKFAEGGVVPGTSYTGDKVLIRANSGERVLTKEMSDNLVKMLAQGVPSWGMDYERLEQAFIRAASRVPAPVLDYSEFVAYGRKVAMEKEKMMEY